MQKTSLIGLDAMTLVPGYLLPTAQTVCNTRNEYLAIDGQGFNSNGLGLLATMLHVLIAVQSNIVMYFVTLSI